MTTLLASLNKLCTATDTPHLQGAATTAYQYLREKPFMLWITIAFAVCLVAAIILIVVLSVKAHKHTKAIRNIQEYPQVDFLAEQEQTQETAENTTEDPAEDTAEDPAEDTVIVTEQETTPTNETAQETAQETAPTDKTPSAIEDTATDKNNQEPKKESVAPVAPPVESKKTSKYRGKWVFYKLTTQQEGNNSKEEMYFFELRASNGEKLLESQEYTSLFGAKKGIETHLNNIAKNNFKVCLTKKGTYIFKLMNAKGLLLCTGENYTTRAGCESAIESTKRFAETAAVEETVQEIVIKPPADDDNSSFSTPSEGAVGKWIISKQTDDLGEESYYFELFANNGEKLLSSEEYTSESGALSGLETHKKNIEQGRFRIVPTKRGDYIFKLLNANNQLLCLGEHYKTRRMCQRAVESVKRFALTSPIVNEE